MPTSRDAVGLAALQIERNSDLALHQQIAAHLRASILTGQLEAGIRLPPTREAARVLEISRNTVLYAYEQLKAEGYLEARVGSGTYVTEQLPEDLGLVREYDDRELGPDFRGERRVSTRGRRIEESSIRGRWTDYINPDLVFTPGTPDLSAFPLAKWRTLQRRVLSGTSRWDLRYRGGGGLEPLRRAIAGYLKAARGVRCDPSQIIITSGSQQALYLAGLALLDPGDKILMEDPGYDGARRAFRALGAVVRGLPVAADGVELGPALWEPKGVRAVYITPSHQFPVGSVMSLPDRLELLRWAHDQEGWILEDDYDSEFRYSGRPVPALQGLDAAGQVLYIGTFSKVMFPALRIGYLVVPPDLVDVVLSARSALDLHPPFESQVTLSEFLARGHFARHVRRMRVLYRERCHVLAESLQKELGPLADLGPSQAGLHLVLWLPPTVDDRRAAIAAMEHEVQTIPLSAYASAPLHRPGLVLGFAAAEPAAIRAGAKRLALALSGLSLDL